jgi:hypothetical protein
MAYIMSPLTESPVSFNGFSPSFLLSCHLFIYEEAIYT